MTVFDVNKAGIGDAVVATWIAEGANRLGHNVVFQSGSKDELLKALGCTVGTYSTPAIQFGGHAPSYKYELGLTAAQRTSRTDMWQLECPFVTSAQRPTATLSEEAADWADDMIDDRPVALLFPFAAYVPRTWPLHKWIRLAHALQGKGFKVIALHSHVEGLEQFPFYAYGFSLMHVMALMRAADVVIANDSGPAHLAGTLGTKTIAICGPTDPHTVFSYCPDIFPIATTAELIGCTGCHFKASLGFTSACDVGCDSLANLGHMLVLKKVDEILPDLSYQPQ